MKDIASYMLIALAMMAFLLTACVQGHDTLAAGYQHNIQIDKDLGMWSWGDNNAGQCGQGHTTDVPTPQPVALLPLTGDPVSVCAGNSFTCVLDSLKNVACTGSDRYGAMGVDVGQADRTVLGVPTGVALVYHLACGPGAILATTTTGTLLVWGRDSYGQLGRGSTATAVYVAEVSFVFSYVPKEPFIKLNKR
jgi:alpha-tubulin suppressor-like RCC1 family protein